MLELERDTVLSLIRTKDSSIEQGPFDFDDILEESEMMTVKMSNENQTKPSYLDAKGIYNFEKILDKFIRLVIRIPGFQVFFKLGVINMKAMPERDHSFLLEQYAFSNAIASSVKLGMLEAR